MKRKIVILVVITSAFVIFGYVIYSNFTQRDRMPSEGAPPAPFSLCKIDNDCIHVIATAETFVTETEPFTFQDCINKSYKESDLKWYVYGQITEKTGKDLCECREVEELEMCAFKRNLP